MMGYLLFELDSNRDGNKKEREVSRWDSKGKGGGGERKRLSQEKYKFNGAMV
jgi:hypothetical protein